SLIAFCYTLVMKDQHKFTHTNNLCKIEDISGMIFLKNSTSTASITNYRAPNISSSFVSVVNQNLCGSPLGSFFLQAGAIMGRPTLLLSFG
ncbi:hypothetical protein L9F63_001437, partial [Diploptera punctata]